ncbi:hypothetical protein [Methylobacterium mesophilicum]
MASLNLDTFSLPGLSVVSFKPRYEHFGDPCAEGDLFIGWDSSYTLTEGERSEVIDFCERVSGNFGSYFAARKHLKSQIAAYSAEEVR